MGADNNKEIALEWNMKDLISERNRRMTDKKSESVNVAVMLSYSSSSVPLLITHKSHKYPDEKKIFEPYVKAAELGYPNAMNDVSDCYGIGS
ncbi:hypothetical protein F8M41_009556 [Gigaspora margarita]|uniref:Uncharacterized protein n=1 Tax=Gigaspora margarita TaxID=4874 RepID=A0A8H4A2Z3_GIGMA|nr:hypothetical protein F8M41_009556 [Gigaspora margarita]